MSTRTKLLFIAVAAIIASGPISPIRIYASQTALLIQQSPSNGGTVTPGIGVHNFENSRPVAITAVARPGYQFVYWMGDVNDSAANSTTVILNSPKIIIAIFERVEFEFAAGEEAAKSTPHHGLRASGGNYSRPGGGGAGGPKARSGSGSSDISENDDFPVPPDDDQDDFPVPVPEPTTVIILLAGCGLLRKKFRTAKGK